MRKQNESSGHEIHGANRRKGRQRGARQEQVTRKQGGKSGGNGAVEEWRAVKGFEGIYEVSDIGRVRQIRPYNRSEYGRIRKPHPHKEGYNAITLTDMGRVKSFLIHRLVAAAFIGPCPEGKGTNHKNGNKRDNRVENLEYMTAVENNRHAIEIGIAAFKGEQNGQAKLTEQEVQWARDNYTFGGHRQGGMGYKALAARLGTGWSNIRNIIKRQSWAHI